MNVRVAAYGKLRRLWRGYALLAVAALITLLGLAALIEMTYHLQLGQTTEATLRYLGLTLDTKGAASWVGAFLVAGIGFAAFEFVRRRFAHAWGTIQGEIEAEIRSREAS